MYMCGYDFVNVSLIGCFCDWQSNLLSHEERTFFKDNNSSVKGEHQFIPWLQRIIMILKIFLAMKQIYKWINFLDLDSFILFDNYVILNIA